MDDLDDWMSRYEQLGMHIIARSLDLNREERFVTDGLLKAEQCNELLTLAEVGKLAWICLPSKRLCELNSFSRKSRPTTCRIVH